MNGSAPNCSATGSQVDVARKWNPNLLIAREEPFANCQPTRNTSAATASAIASVKYSNALSPKRDGGDIRATTEGSASAEIAGLMTPAIVEPPAVELHLDFVDALQHTLAQVGRQRRIIKILRHIFAFGQRPLQKLDQLFSLGRILLLLVNQEPRSAGNGIGIFSRHVGD